MRRGGGREDREARLDLIDAASDRSTGESPLRMAEERGLSLLPDPGILERSDRNERVESFVSERLKEGYDCISGPDDLEDEPPPLLSLEPWLPILPKVAGEVEGSIG